MRKRRRTRYEWLFNTGTTGPNAEATDSWNGRDIVATALANAVEGLSIVDLLTDTGSDEQATNLPMGVYERNEYVVKRIVGKWFVEFIPGQTTPSDVVVVTAGIFVARAGDAADFGGAENLPVGTDATGTGKPARDAYSPVRVENIREPWMWRRQWILSNGSGTTATTSGTTYPKNTAQYGSIQDGPHMDCKSSRRVREGERLFAVLSAKNYPPNQTSTNQTQVRAWLDYRVLGAMRKGHNKSTF